MAVKRVFVYGGKGALGAACVTQFKALNWVSESIVFLEYYAILLHKLN